MKPTTDSPATDLITIREASTIAHVSIHTIRARVIDGSLRAWKFGPKSHRVSHAEVLGLLSAS